MRARGKKSYCFQGFTIDLKRGCLRDADDEIELRPKSFEVLRYLVENAGRLVSKDELVRAVWPEVVVTDNSLTRCVSDVRQALRDSDQRTIKTVPRRGYLFAAAVSLQANDAGSPPPSAEAISVPPRLSIVVLPLVNMRGDPQQDYIADVITEELTSSVSRIYGSFVIARSTAFTYKGKAVDVKQVGKDLGVRYVLEGSEQHTDTRVRVNVQLIDAKTGAHLWADQFDLDRHDLLRTQEEVVTRLARALEMELVTLEATRIASEHANNPDAEDFALRCDAEVNRWICAGGYSAGEPEVARRLGERALELDPNNVRALIIMADLLALGVLASHSSDDEADLRRADELVSRALAADPNHYWAHYSKAAVLLAQKQTEAALVEADRSLSLNPSFTPSYSILCAANRFLGRPEKAIECADAALRLSPRDPIASTYYLQKGLAYFALRKNDEAIDWLNRAHAAAPGLLELQALLAAVLALDGRLAEARKALEQYVTRGRMRTIARWKGRRQGADTPYYLADRARLYEGLRKAGMPDE
jgi:TolB-like protein/Tfp pilus assembly protein PilF